MSLRSIIPRPGKLLDTVLALLLKIGFFDIVRYCMPPVLTVLGYHRVEDPLRSDFDLFRPNVSATPLGFARQMDYVQRHYTAITCEHLLGWLRGEQELPRHPLIITFDDGYRDNLRFAYPILKERNLPAVIFLPTGFIGTDLPFYWDYVAYLFSHTQRTSAHLPVTGETRWTTAAEREKVMVAWVDCVKKLPEAEKRRAVSEIATILDVRVSEGVFSNLYLNWEQIRMMGQNHIEFGAHTVNHPILTRISKEVVEEEVRKSKQQIEDELQRPVSTFAYPNGQRSDFSDEIIRMVREAGIEIAFTLLPGPTPIKAVKENPLAIRRIFLIHSDSFPRFVAKLLGLSYWIS